MSTGILKGVSYVEGIMHMSWQ